MLCSNLGEIRFIVGAPGLKVFESCLLLTRSRETGSKADSLFQMGVGVVVVAAEKITALPALSQPLHRICPQRPWRRRGHGS